jgi:hypothetical protein
MHIIQIRDQARILEYINITYLNSHLLFLCIYIGTELFTAFTMSASLWVDPDLPLQYAFGFVDARGTLLYHNAYLSIKTLVLSAW